MPRQWEVRTNKAFTNILGSILHNLRSAFQLMIPRGCVQESASLTVTEQRETSAGNSFLLSGNLNPGFAVDL